MKSRLIDSLDLDTKRSNPDETWFLYANNLMTSFGDLVRDQALAKEHFVDLYCRLRLRKLDEVMLDSLIYNLPPAFFQDKTWLDSYTSELDDLPDNAITDDCTSWRPNDTSPFLLLGHVGTGKTTYLYNYFFVELPARRKDVFAMMFDLNQAPIDEAGMKQYIYSEIEAQLSRSIEEYRVLSRETIFLMYADKVKECSTSFITKKEIADAENRLVSQVLGAKQGLAFSEERITLLHDFLAYYARTRAKKVWFVFDNIDNHVFLSDFNAIKVLREVVSPFKTNFIISLRYISAASAAEANYLSAFRARRLKLSFPDLLDVLKRRLYVFKRIAIESKIYYSRLKWTGNTEKIKDLYVGILRVLAVLRSSNLLFEYLLPLSNYNLRQFLDIMLASFQSYYFFYDRFNYKRYIPNRYNIKQRFMFSQLLKNGDYYNPHNIDSNEQFIINIFENERPAEQFNQLIRLRIIQKMVEHTKEVPASQFRSEVLSVFNYSEEDVCAVLRTFLKCGLLCTRFDPSVPYARMKGILHEIAPEDLLIKGIYIALTFSGKLHYSSLIGDMRYMEVMKYSTYVDSKHQASIQKDDIENNTLEGRRRSTLKFVDYLLGEQAKERETIVDSAAYSAKYEPLLYSIRGSIEKQYDELFRYARRPRNITNPWG